MPEEGGLLPTEPELGEQFSVAAAMVRAQCALLMARGWWKCATARMFVTPVQNRPSASAAAGLAPAQGLA
ncbi:MAG: hypothetical protein R2854_11940 [Caldilineaceae bacterium]